MTSRMFSTPVQYCTRRSNPSPNPACGTDPYLRRSRYHQYVSFSKPTSSMRRSSTSRQASAGPKGGRPKDSVKDLYDRELERFVSADPKSILSTDKWQAHQ